MKLHLFVLTSENISAAWYKVPTLFQPNARSNSNLAALNDDSGGKTLKKVL